MKGTLWGQRILVLMVALLLTACEAAKIGDIQKDPSKYRDKPVRVEGIVTNSFGVLSNGFYEVEDETGKILVLSRQGIPSQGTRVRVEGTVFAGAMIGGQAVGVAIRESEHEVR